MVITLSDKAFPRTCESEILHVGFSGEFIDDIVTKAIAFLGNRVDLPLDVVLR
jgi:hypothetical protein